MAIKQFMVMYKILPQIENLQGISVMRNFKNYNHYKTNKVASHGGELRSCLL